MNHSKFHVAMLLALAMFVTGATIQTVITKLRQMQDVRLATSPTDGHVLTYNSSLGKWTNSAVGAGSSIANNSGSGTNTTLYGLTVIANTAGVGVSVTGAPSTNVVDLNVSGATNILNAALTILHATNGATASERTHVRWLWAGGADRTLTIPSGWKTNMNSAVPASITNGTITRMFVSSIGDTSTSANQTNVFVSFEFYK